MTKIQLELVQAPDMYTLCEKETKGGIFYISKRYKYLKSYDPQEGARHIIYLDANYLYSYAMSKFLSTSGFK